MKSATSHSQVLVQEQRQQLSAQQLLASELTALSVEELCARIDKECIENPWLERTSNPDDDGYGMGNTDSQESTQETDESMEDSLEQNDTLQDYVANENDWESNDFPEAANPEQKGYHERGDELTFHDLLLQQMGEYDLDERQRTLLEFLIGSLDDNGMLTTPLIDICDQLDYKYYITTSVQELEYLLTHVLQEFEPYGIGARSFIECLLIQVRLKEHMPMRSQLLTLFEKHADEFRQNHWDVIKKKMKLSDSEVASMQHAIRRLNPYPGGSVGRASEESAQLIVPDFSVQVNEYGDVQFALCEQGIPRLSLSEDLAEWNKAHDKIDMEHIRRDELEALRFNRKIMERGNMFIEALAQRRVSLTSVMQSILKLQRPFFLEGEESLLRPMRLVDIAEMTGLDISTVSRVCQSKSVSTPYGTFPLKWFFSSGATQDNEDVSVRKILQALKNLIEDEDKHAPLSDDKLTAELNKEGYSVARRTVAKYREQLGIAVARLRKI